MAGSHRLVCAGIFLYLELLVSGERAERGSREINLHNAQSTPAPRSIEEVSAILRERAVPQEASEVPEIVSGPSVNQDLPFFTSLLDTIIAATAIDLDADDQPEPAEGETEESNLDKLIAAFEAFEDVMEIHNFPTLSIKTREATFTQARKTLADKVNDFTPEDVAVAARVVDASGSWRSAKRLCPVRSQEEGQEEGILNASETAIVEKRTSQWAGKVAELNGKCDGFRERVVATWTEYGTKVAAFERAHDKMWFGSNGSAIPAFSYGQRTFDALTRIKVTPRAVLTELSARLPGQYGDFLKKEEVCKLQDNSLEADAMSESELHALQLASHKLLLDYKKVCEVSAMIMLIRAAFTASNEAWVRPMLCGDHHLWDTQELVEAGSDISKVTDGLEEAETFNNMLQPYLNPGGGGFLVILQNGLAPLREQLIEGVQQMFYDRFGDQLELVQSWYTWFQGWLAYGNWIWNSIGYIWRGATAASTLGLSEATPSTERILKFFVESSPWALKKAMTYYKGSHQSPNCKKLAADESGQEDLE